MCLLQRRSRGQINLKKRVSPSLTDQEHHSFSLGQGLGAERERSEVAALETGGRKGKGTESPALDQKVQEGND